MKIKMKVKHLVLLVAGILVLTPLLLNIVLPAVQLSMAEKSIESRDVEKKQEILDLLDSTPFDTKKWEIIQEYMVGGGLTNQFDVYIGPSSTQWTPVETDFIPFTWEEKLPYVQEYVEKGPVNGYLRTAAMVLANHYENKGKIEKAQDVLFDAANRFAPSKEYNRNELLLERAKIAEKHDQLKKANQYLDDLMAEVALDDYDMNARIAQMRTEMILKQGKLEEAYDKLENTLKNYEKEYNKEQEKWQEEFEEDDPIFDSTVENSVVYQQLKTLQHSLGKAKAQGGASVVTVSGKVVRSDGTPLENVGVFLRDESVVNQSVMTDEPYQVVTDENGRFEFRGVIPNNYQIFIGIQFDQIDGWTWPVQSNDWIDIDGSKDITYNVTLRKLIEVKSPVNQKVIKDDHIHFAWQKIKGAASYSLSLGYEMDGGGSISTQFKSGIKDNQLDVPIEAMYNQQGGIAFGEGDILQPESILAFTNPENRFFWSVSAYAADGKLITSSNGYRLDNETIGNLPFFYLKTRELNDADQLLLDNKTEEALARYKANYKNDPDDLHNLRMIVRLIGVNTDGSTLERDKLAIPYMEDLALKTTSAKQVFPVLMYYYDQQAWDDFNQWWGLYIDRGGVINDYTQSIYASALMKQGKHAEASKQFAKALKIDDSHRFIGNWLANELYQNGDFTKAEELAIQYPERSFVGITPNWLQLVKEIEEESKDYQNYHQELQKALDLYFKGQEESLEQWQKTSKMAAMKEFVRVVQNVN